MQVYNHEYQKEFPNETAEFFEGLASYFTGDFNTGLMWLQTKGFKRGYWRGVKLKYNEDPLQYSRGLALVKFIEDQRAAGAKDIPYYCDVNIFND